MPVMYILVPSGLNKTPVGFLCWDSSQLCCPTKEETAPKVVVFEKTKIIKDIIYVLLCLKKSFLHFYYFQFPLAN